MRKLLFYFSLLLCLGSVVASCDSESYANKRKTEKKAIAHFISEHGIEKISMEQFLNQDSTTDTLKNQFVYLSSSDVYMQIVNKGTGPHARKMASGENRNLICRFAEINIESGDTILTNLYDASVPDIMSVQNSSGTYTASFLSGYMYSTYSSYSTTTGYVPNGWLAALPYINITRLSDTDVPAKIRLIVPSTEGQAEAMSEVYPCYYEITITGDRN